MKEYLKVSSYKKYVLHRKVKVLSKCPTGGYKRTMVVKIIDDTGQVIHIGNVDARIANKALIKWAKATIKQIKKPSVKDDSKQFIYRSKVYTVLNGSLYSGKEMTLCTHVSPCLMRKASLLGYNEGIKHKSIKTKKL